MDFVTVAEKTLQKITFIGEVVNGRGTHSELFVPGRVELNSSHVNWPTKLSPGSLNIKIRHNGYPIEFSQHKLRATVSSLDKSLFKAAFEIKREQFRNNILFPSKHTPNGGDAQVWISKLEVNNRLIPCWVLRRYGSRLRTELEVVSDVKIRTTISLSTDIDWPCKLYLYGEWMD